MASQTAQLDLVRNQDQAAAAARVVAALREVPTAVIRIGAMVIIKADSVVTVYTLTSEQLQTLR